MSSYQDRLLIEYLPTVLTDVREFQVIVEAEQPEIFDLFNEIKIALENQFLLTLTEYGVIRWEKILKIVPKATYTLEERRFTIIALLSKQLPYTMRMLEIMLTELCGADGYEINLDANTYNLEVRIALTAINNFNDVDLMLKLICPANLIIALSVIFNQHFKLKQFKHGELKSWTHYQLRNEVL